MAMASRAPACAASQLVARGRESAAVLQALLLGQQALAADGGASASPHGLRELTDQILRCCDRALAALRHRGTEEEDADAAAGTRKRKPERGNGTAASPGRASKRQRVRGEEMGTRVEKRPTMEDGFIWKKYGQKEIHGSKYPRLYFRCTYKEDHGCTARRQVQRWEADPSVFLITYFGDHTCCRDREDEDLPAPFVINFSSSSSHEKPTGSPWPSSDDGLVVSKTPDLCNSPEEELRSSAGMDNESEFVDQSTLVAELTSMSSMDLEGCLDWMLWDGENSFYIGDEFIGHDFNYLDVMMCFHRNMHD